MYIDLERDYSRSTFICGAGRSGTTWLAELLCATNQYRYLYEPFNREQVVDCEKFSARQYLRPQDDRQQFLETAGSVFSGRIRNGWIDQYNRRIISRRRLVKDVRSTLMLKWIHNHFPKMPIIFMVRHPYAVALSRVKEGWRTDLREVFYCQPDLMADYLMPFSAIIEQAKTAFERHLIDWCIENFVPFSQLDPGDAFLMFYENVCADPAVELKKLHTFLGVPFHEDVLLKLGRRSASSTRKWALNFPNSDSNRTWNQQLSPSEMAFGELATQTFGLDRIYGTSSRADVSAAENLLIKKSSGIVPPISREA